MKTIRGFLKALKRDGVSPCAEHEWDLVDFVDGVDGPAIALYDKHHDIHFCPIAALAYLYDGDLTQSSSSKVIAQLGVELGLSRKDAHKVIAATDKIKGHDKKLRQKLLKAVGLVEE